jgi:hypothetical protein
VRFGAIVPNFKTCLQICRYIFAGLRGQGTGLGDDAAFPWGKWLKG